MALISPRTANEMGANALLLPSPCGCAPRGEAIGGKAQTLGQIRDAYAKRG